MQKGHPFGTPFLHCKEYQILLFCFPVIDQFVDRFLYRHDPGRSPGVAAGKRVTVFEIAFECVIQSGNDAIGASRNIASLDAVERTALRLLQAFFHFLQECAVYRSSRHADRTLDDLDVLFFRFYIAFLESLGSVALGGGNETGT